MLDNAIYLFVKTDAHDAVLKNLPCVITFLPKSV